MTHRIIFRLPIALVAAVVAACGAAAAPSASSPTMGSPSAVASTAPASVGPRSASPAPPSASPPRRVEMTVAGTENTASPIRLTVELPDSWSPHNGPFAANRGTAHPPAGMSFFTSLVDNTFQDPCEHRERSPKIGSSPAALAAALAAIPHTTSTEPVATAIGQRKATYVELAVQTELPCEPTSFYLWQDSPGGYWWALGGGETIRVWIVDVRGQRVAIAARSYPGTGKEAQTEFETILASMAFDAGT